MSTLMAPKSNRPISVLPQRPYPLPTGPEISRSNLLDPSFHDRSRSHGMGTIRIDPGSVTAPGPGRLPEKLMVSELVFGMQKTLASVAGPLDPVSMSAEPCSTIFVHMTGSTDWKQPGCAWAGQKFPSPAVFDAVVVESGERSTSMLPKST